QVLAPAAIGPEVVPGHVDQVDAPPVRVPEAPAVAHVRDQAQIAGVLEYAARPDRELELQARGRDRLGVRVAPEGELGPDPDLEQPGARPDERATPGVEAQTAELVHDDREAVRERHAGLGAEEGDVAAVIEVLRAGDRLPEEDRAELGEGPRVFGE